MSSEGGLVERLLKEFVDRTAELQLFCDNVAPDGYPILLYWGPGGLGKTSLLHRMTQECAQRGVRSFLVDWKTNPYDYLWTMRELRDFLGSQYFNEFTDLVNFYTVPHYELTVKVDGEVSVLKDAQIQDSKIGNVTGVIIQDLQIASPRVDTAVPPEEKRALLTERFIACLSKLLKSSAPAERVVIFLDSAEKMSREMQSWLWGQLLWAVAQGRLPRVHFVLLGREKLPNDLELDLKRLVRMAELKPLAEEHIVDYLGRRGIDVATSQMLALLLLASSEGNPNVVATTVDAFLEMKRSKEQSVGRPTP
jgi:hypothetical protein